MYFSFRLFYYCNSLYSGLPSSTLRPLQIAQNFAARIILQRSKFCHITPVLRELHWLPVESRIKFKVMLFTYKSLNDLAPPYLTSLLSYQCHSRSLRSSSSKTLTIPRTYRVKMGDRAFSVAAPKLWKTLSTDIQNSPCLTTFKNKLKTHLFSIYFDPTWTELILSKINSIVLYIFLCIALRWDARHWWASPGGA